MVFNLLVNHYHAYNVVMKNTSIRPSNIDDEAVSGSLTEDTRAARKRIMTDARRTLVLDAARAVFLESGLEQTTIREIARRAGYTPGAIYSYFPGKEAVYGALLSESLERLNAEVASAQPVDAHSLDGVLRVKARAFFDFYRCNPRDLDLGFYLFQGLKPRGLTRSLNESLNSLLRDALRPTQDALCAMGMPEHQALAELTALFAHIVGLLMLSHTGRIRMFKQDPEELFDAYLDQLAARTLEQM